MKKIRLPLVILCLYAIALQISSQVYTDVSSLYLKNAGFDTNFNYGSATSGNIPGDVINRVYGWEKDMDAGFTVAGTFAYGSGATFNGSSAIPNEGYNGSTGGALALSTGWSVTLKYSQTITLPAGEYRLVSAYYNAGTATAGSSQLAWTPVGDEEMLSTVKSFPVKTWHTDTINFIVPQGGLQGKIQIGFTGVDGASTNSAKILVDYVKLLYAGIDKTVLNQRIAEAEAVYGDGTGINADVLLVAINAAKAVVVNENASMEEIVAVADVLPGLMLEYQLQNASPETPFDMTDYIVNPSFESEFTGWTNNGMAIQTNTVFPFKNGANYIEKWVNRGSKVPNVGVQQHLTGLYNGQYTLRVAAGNIQQTAAGSWENNSSTPQTGVSLFAGTENTPVNTVQEYAVSFVVFDNETTIGLKSEGATGNWVTCDNFRLHYEGYDITAIATYVGRQVTIAQGLLPEKMQKSAKQELEIAISQAQQATQATPLVLDDLNKANNRLLAAIDIAEISISACRDLQIAIDSARVVYGNGDENEADALLRIISEAQILLDELTADLDEISNAEDGIYKGILAFRLANASGTVPRVVTNSSYARGATRIFGRSTVGGIAASNILEQGFCWSTHPEPTVLDNRTTSYYEKNGRIYRLENLEPSTVYYIRAYAITKTYAVGYGDVVKVITIPKGNITFTLAGSVTGAPGHHERIKEAIETAVDYWNNLTSIRGHHLSVSHHLGTPTAEGSYGGYIQFGPAAYQQTGTALHEMGHTIGVGTHSIWYGPSSPLRENGSTGKWLGERANKVVQFILNDRTAGLSGDAVHMWPFAINGPGENSEGLSPDDFLFTANGLVTQGLGEDGLPPTGGFTTPAYTFASDDNVKYYIKNEDERRGRNTSYLVENAAGRAVHKKMTTDEALQNDSAAWYFRFNPATCYYQIRNAATGKYFTYKSNAIALDEKTLPGETENIQLMLSRVSSEVGSGANSLNVKGYWIIRPEHKLNPPCLTLNMAGITTTATFDLTNSAISQRWLLMTGEEIRRFEQALQPSALQQISSMSGISIYGEKAQIRLENITTPSAIRIYDVSGRLQSFADEVTGTYLQTLPEGVYVVSIRSEKYKDVGKVVVK